MESLRPRGSIHEKYRSARRHSMAQEMANKYQERGLQGFSDYLSEAFNIDVRYEKKEDDPDRERLNIESGLIISNHPGYIDTPAILRTLTKRKQADLKIVVAEESYDVYSRATDKELFIPTARNHSIPESRKMIENIVEHIREHDGVVLMYPSGDLDRQADVEFRNGFRMILNQISDDKMVYCFNFKAEETKKILNKLGIAGLYSGALSLPFNVNKLRSPVVLNVSERYTRAAEWKSLIGSSNIPQANKVLGNHYLKLFGSSDC